MNSLGSTSSAGKVTTTIDEQLTMSSGNGVTVSAVDEGSSSASETLKTTVKNRNKGLYAVQF